LESADDFQQLALKTCEEGQAFKTADGTYMKWSPGAGIELWAQLDHYEEIIGLNPHFRGKGQMRVGFVERITRPDGTILDGAFYGWANPSDDVVTDGEFPFVFDIPNYKICDAQLGSAVSVQLAAFAHELHSYKNEKEFDKSQAKRLNFASRSFIPSGLFTPEGEDTTPPQAYAIFTGHVLDTSLITNPVTGLTFCWSHVSTLGGEVDVVADPVLLNDVITKGGVVTGSFWLSGVVN
jgi:hypothetical protein